MSTWHANKEYTHIAREKHNVVGQPMELHGTYRERQCRLHHRENSNLSQDVGNNTHPHARTNRANMSSCMFSLYLHGT